MEILKRQETGTKHVAIVTSKSDHLIYFVGCNILAQFQKHCFIIGGDIVNFVSQHCTCNTDDVVSD